MATTETERITESAISAITSYASNISPAIAGRLLNAIGVALDITAGAGCTGVTFKVQVKSGGLWIDLYRDESGTFVLEEYTIPVVALGTEQKRAFRLSCGGIRDIRLQFKSVGGNASINWIDIAKEADFAR